MKLGHFPIWDKCPKCNSEMTERKFLVIQETPYIEALSWHCKACSYDWHSRTMETPPFKDEHTCWLDKKKCLICIKEGEEIDQEEPEKPKRKGKLKPAKEIIEQDILIPDDEELPI